MPDQQVSQFLKEEKVFSFADAVAEAKRDFPKETADITFIDLAAPDAHEQVFEFAKAAELNPTEYKHLLAKIESKAAVATVLNGHKVLAIPSSREGDLQSFPGDDYKSAYFCFQHELGHFVVADAQGQHGGTGQYKESAADSFAMLRGLKAGVFAKSDLLALADRRGHEMLMTTDFCHMTAMALDSIAINPKNTDFLSLSNKEIAKIAERHAETFAASSEVTSKFTRLQTRRGWGIDADGVVLSDTLDQKLHDLYDLAMSASPKSQEFYLAARVLNTVFETGKITWGRHEHTVDVSAAHWQEAKKALQEKSGDRDIGAKKAHESVSLYRPGEVPKSLISRIGENFKPLKI